ncbi:hypothetical protein B0J11DRAFT_481656 [Dendryphion nanum]|uniref:Tyrosinase copper-binding domain-containing protein n=1 Tax=Dendryphion nanum TaxID=256645 RepID=A0A9P9E827_9PLEO|nr:hypothetical protein B0J11DRAFT_481656 [Dendryphion nanum]
MSQSSRLNMPPARTRFDDLQMVHVIQTEDVHGVGGFLPFHRYFVHIHEQLLRTECNYTSGQPYWDETIDAGHFSTSIILDPISGFGGNGSGEDDCISDGPFKDYVGPIGPRQIIQDHCIYRVVNDCASATGKSDVVERCMKSNTYIDFWNCLEALPHTAGHGGIGGQMFDVFSSPGDPLFYLHHAWLDKLWADWQAQNSTMRTLEMGGTNQGFPLGSFPPLPSPPFGTPVNGVCPELPPPGEGIPGFPALPIPEPFKPHEGDPANVTTLGHMLMSAEILPNATVADVMDTKGGYLCYEYL